MVLVAYLHLELWLNEPIVRFAAVTIIVPSVVLVPLLLCIASWVLWIKSIIAIKQSKGKLIGNRSAFWVVFLSTAHIEFYAYMFTVIVIEHRLYQI